MSVLFRTEVRTWCRSLEFNSDGTYCDSEDGELVGFWRWDPKSCYIEVAHKTCRFAFNKVDTTIIEAYKDYIKNVLIEENENIK